MVRRPVEHFGAADEDLVDLLADADIAVIFVDLDLQVRRLTPAAGAILNGDASPVGRALADAAAGFPDETLVDDVRGALEALSLRQAEVVTPEGRCYLRCALPCRGQGDRVEGVVITLADVTELDEATRQVRVRGRQQRAVAALGQLALTGYPLRRLLDRAAHAVARTLGVELTSVLELRPQQPVLQIRAGAGWREGIVRRARISAAAEGDAGFALQTRAPVVVEDFDQEIRFPRGAHLADHGVVSGISVAIPGRTHPFGVLSAYATTRRRFTDDDVCFLESVAHILAEAASRRTIKRRLCLRKFEARLVRRATAAAAEASSGEAALRACLGVLCKRIGWPVGHVHVIDEGNPEALVSAGIWRLPENRDLREWCRAIERQAVRRGNGTLPGRVWAAVQPLWIEDVQDDPSSFPVPGGPDPLPKTALGFPIMTGSRVAAVIELFSFRKRRRDEHLLAALGDIGAQVGRILEWHRAEAALRAMTNTLEDLAARRTQLLTLMHEMAAAANRAATVEEILAVVLRRMSEHDGWAFAQAYFVSEADERRFVMAGHCYESAPGRFASFREATGNMLWLGDDELLRRVVAGRGPVWASEVYPLLSGARAPVAKALGIENALAVPVLSGDNVVAVMEFFGDRRIRPREERMEARVIRSIASSVARVYERQALERALAGVAVEEHRRIGRTLHDSIIQGITGLEMLARTIAKKTDVEPDRFEQLLEGIRETRGQVRALTRRLVPVDVEADGLMDALARLAEQTSGEYGITCTVGSEDGLSVAQPAATHLYHIAREAVHIAVTHARPADVRIALRRDGESMVLSIADDGGDAAELRRGGAGKAGLGLQIMQYRARMVDGTLTVEPGDSGVTITCTAPLRGDAAPRD